jgi:hypothetical protein
MHGLCDATADTLHGAPASAADRKATAKDPTTATGNQALGLLLLQ